MEKRKNIAIVFLCFILLFGFLLSSVLKADEALSYTERRKLAQMPSLNGETIASGEFFSDLESYFLDQFPLRDEFRSLKAFVSFHVLQRKDNNEIYKIGDAIYKMEYPLREKQVRMCADKITAIYEQYLQGMNVYYGVIPDKNYYVAKENGYPSLDYDKMMGIIREELPQLQEIKLFDCLSAEDYFRTDPHWRQDRLDKVVERFEEVLGLELSSSENYIKTEFSPFYGAYYGQAALSVQPDKIIYLENETTKASTLYDAEPDTVSGIYTPEQYDGMDGYDVFLGGAAAFQVIENPNQSNGRELVIFRDSFSSSLTPLLLEGYSQITLIDLRYFSSSMLSEFIEFTDQDVLFLYSTLIWNQGSILK